MNRQTNTPAPAPLPWHDDAPVVNAFTADPRHPQLLQLQAVHAGRIIAPPVHVHVPIALLLQYVAHLLNAQAQQLAPGAALNIAAAPTAPALVKS